MLILGRFNLPMRKGLRSVLQEFRQKFSAQAEELTENAAKIETSTSSNKHFESKPFVPLNYRFVYPEFLPDPNPLHRNTIREKLERKDMLARRSQVEIPEFYVGSIIAVTVSDPHAPGKSNRFLGICIKRTGCGLRASFIVRNVIDKIGVEVHYDLYDPSIQKIELIKLEKRLDDELLYLRDCPQEYSTFPVDMEPEFLPDNSEVPVNKIVVPLKPTPWHQRWERKNMKGLQDPALLVNLKRQIKAKWKMHQKPWEKFDLMKEYRETIPEEEQREIFAEVHAYLHKYEIVRQRMKRSRSFIKPKKSG